MVKNSLANAGDTRDACSIPGLGRSPGEGKNAAHSGILAWEVPWERSLAGYSPWGRKEPDVTDCTHKQKRIRSELPFSLHPIQFSQCSIFLWSNILPPVSTPSLLATVTNVSYHPLFSPSPSTGGESLEGLGG